MINLPLLFRMQKDLDNHILQEQGLKAAPFNERILAFIVEMGECANEWKGFKFWKRPENRKPRIHALRNPAMMPEDQDWYNPLLEEFVDKVHFVVSLGISMKMDPEKVVLKDLEVWKADSITEQFIQLAGIAHSLYTYRAKQDWNTLLRMTLGLGEMLGFTQQDIQNAYMKKNAINHTRQVQGY